MFLEKSQKEPGIREIYFSCNRVNPAHLEGVSFWGLCSLSDRELCQNGFYSADSITYD